MAEISQEERARKANEREAVVKPLDQIDPAELPVAKKAVNAWLIKISGGHVTLDRAVTVASAVPILGNILAAIDAVCDIIVLVENKAANVGEKALNWASFGINLIGIVPFPPTMAAARTSLRPALHLVRSKLGTAGHGLSDALVVMLVDHLNATLAGELEKFVAEASTKLKDILKSAATMAHDLLSGLSKVLRKLASGTPFDAGTPAPAEPPKRDPETTYESGVWGAIKGIAGDIKERVEDGASYVGEQAAQGAKVAANAGAGLMMRHTDVGEKAAKLMNAYADSLDSLAADAKTKIERLGDAGVDMSIAWLLLRLKDAVLRYRAKGKTGGSTVNPTTTATHAQKKTNAELDRLNAERVNGVSDANPCKNCKTRAQTPNAISFASGSETFVHTDFALPGHMPIVWSRTYHSRLAAYDNSQPRSGHAGTSACLGARWTSPYTTRIDQAADGSLSYFAADGREHRFPKLAEPEHGNAGQVHHNAIEDLTLGRGNGGVLVLSHGRDYVETFELAPRFVHEGTARTRNKAVHYRLASQRTRAGQTTELAYRHEGGQLSDIVSGQVHVSTAIDAHGRIQSLWLVQDGQAVRQLAAYTYRMSADGSSDLIAAQDENEQSWHYEYRRAGETASTHLISRYTDRTGRGIHLQWEHEDGNAVDLHASNSARARAYREYADDGSFDTTIVWNNHVRLATVVDALGAQTRYYFDFLGYTYRIVHPEVRGADGMLYAHEEWFFRDALKNITRHLHADGSSDHYTYDAHGNLVSHTRADHSTVHFAHDDMDNLTGIRDAEGHAWKRTYEGVNLIEEIDPLGHKTEYAYNEHGLPVEITDARGGKKQLAYDDAGQLTAYTDCSGKTSSWTYDDSGHLLKAENAAGEATQYHYERGQLARIVNPDGSQEQLVHDAEGRLLLHRDALHRETRYEYNAVGLIAQRLDANRHTIEYQWDRLGRLTALRNENGRTHSFSYDPLGKLRSEVQFDGSRTAYGYTPATGVLRQVTEGDAVTQFDFDPTGRLTKRTAGLYIESRDPDGHPRRRTLDLQSIQTDSYAYDGNGQLIDARNPHIHLQWFPDAAGNVRTEHHHYLIDEQGRPGSQPLTAVWQHRYDELGNRIQTTRPDGHTTTWLTYGSGHVHGLMLDDMEALQIERDDLHREVKRTQANEVAQEQQYDPAGRLKAQVLGRVDRLGQSRGGPSRSIPNASALGIQRKYSYDRAGQLTDIGDSRRGSLSYRYDPVGRLLQARSQLGTETFAFDPASNILDPMAPAAREAGAIHSIPAILNNLVKDYAGTHFEYDSRGNMVERRHNGQRTRFAWDALGRLAEARTQDTRTSFLYDPLGRRIAKCSEPNVITSSMDGSQYHAAEYRRQMQARGLGAVLFGWDGDQMAWESEAARNRTVHYVFEPNSFVPVLQASARGRITQNFLRRPAGATRTYTDAQGNYDLDQDPLYNGVYEPGLGQDGEPPAPLENIHYYQCDHLGTPMELTDEGGNIAWEANYKAWGEARLTISEAARKAGLKNPIRFQGQYLDEETGLHYNRFRYYDPVVGRFVSKDPIKFAGGLNFQQYAPNPSEWIDPLGLAGNRANRRAGKILQDHDAVSGGHAYSRHGAHTTMAAQERRATTGVPPDKPCKIPKGSGPDSTRFLNNIDQLDAIQRAKQEMNRTGKNEATVDMKRVIGEGFRSGGGCPETTRQATVFKGPYGIITAFPQLPIP
ncbi:RHS repeat-associated protein [Variovorax boronicumulans]|uniref:RHS repeat-associated core domain-containing protein n=1 Tax=Variovorax boronicumulans TaxID=436515 RepID=UPI002780BC9C|nr:RHS repeat-associated core domain-containing protein [Variovorax boronicumulans]MDQ0016303.1 RHS repeat-associated protein [Variovorax boronicumulans]